MGQKTEEALESAWLNAEQKLTAARVCIRELERQLAECVAAIRRWSETLPDTKEDFLAALYALDVAERSIESAAPEAAERIEKLAQQLEVERQERQDAEWECNALRERVAKHIADQLDYWKQEAQK